MNRPNVAGLGKRLITNTLHAASGRLSGVVVWVVFAPRILEHLGPEGFALFAIFYALTGQFAALDFGLVQGTLRHVAAAREKSDHRAAGAFAALAVIGFVILAVGWLALTVLAQDAVLDWLRIPGSLAAVARFTLFTAPAVFLVSGVANIAIVIAQGYGRFDLANRVVLGLAAQQAIGIPVVLELGWGLRGLVLNVGVGWALGALLGVLMMKRAAPEFRWRFDAGIWTHLPQAVSFGAPMQMTNILWAVNMHVDKFLLSRLVALAAVTPYEFGARVAGAAVTFPQLLLLAALPAVAGLHARGEDARIQSLYGSGSRYVLMATGIVVAALLAAADRLYSVWPGQDIVDAAFVLRGWAMALGLAMAGGMATTVARGIGRTDIEAWVHAVALAVHAATSIALLPTFGVRGAVMGLAAGQLAGAVILFALLSRALRWSWASTLVRPNLVPALATAAGAVAGLLVDRAIPARLPGLAGWLGLLAAAGAGAVVALSVGLVTRYVSWSEFERTFRGPGRPTQSP